MCYLLLKVCASACVRLRQCAGMCASACMCASTHTLQHVPACTSEMPASLHALDAEAQSLDSLCVEDARLSIVALTDQITHQRIAPDKYQSYVTALTLEVSFPRNFVTSRPLARHT